MTDYKILTAEDEKRIEKAVARYLVENIDNGKEYAQGIRSAWRMCGKKIVFPADLIRYARNDLRESKTQKSPYLQSWLDGRATGYLLIAENA